MAYNNVGLADKKYVSALDPMLDTREIDHNVYDIWRENAFTDILNIGDRKVPLKQQLNYNSWVNDQLFKPIVLTAATGTGTATATLTTDTVTSGFVRIGDVILFKDGASGVAQSVSNAAGKDTITVKCPNGNITVAGTETLYVYSYAAGERGDAPVNKRFGVSKYSNKAQIFAETSQITDVQMFSRIESDNGEYIYIDHLNKLSLLKGGINLAFIVSNMSTNSFSDAAPTLVDQNNVPGGGGGGSTQTTRGLYHYNKAYGSMLTATGSGTSGAPVPNGNVAITDMDAVCDQLIAKRAPKEQYVMAGSAVRRGFDKCLKNLGSSGVQSVRMIVDGKELDATVDKFTYSGFEFNFATVGALDHSSVAGTVIGKNAYFMPYQHRIKTVDGGDAAAIRVRYKPNQMALGNEMIGEAHNGAYAPTPVGTVREFKCSWDTTQGFECLAPSFLTSLQVLA